MTQGSEPVAQPTDAPSPPVAGPPVAPSELGLPLQGAPARARWVAGSVAGSVAGRLRWIVTPAAIYVASRALVILAAGVAVLRSPHLGLGQALVRWDSGWYLRLARSGYPGHLPSAHGHVLASTIAFFPLFPLTMSAGSALTGLSLAVVGLALSSAFGMAAAITVWALARDLWGKAAANRACAMFCVFPGAFVFSMIYSEGLMIALAAGCLVALLKRRWLLAGTLAALATAARPNALALVAACAWVAAVAIYRRREWAAMWAPALAPVGIGVYFAYLWARTGDVGAWFATEKGGWHESFDATATFTRLARFVHHPFPSLNTDVGMLCLAFIIVTGVVLLRAHAPGALVVYAAAVAALTLVSKLYGPTPRFVVTAFPLVIVLGYRLRGVALAATLALSAAAMGWLMVLTATSLALTP